VWSLLDMFRYGVRDLHLLLLWIEHEISNTYSQEGIRHGVGALLTAEEKERVTKRVGCVRKHFVSLELHDSVGACDEVISNVAGQHPSTVTLGECRGYLLSLRHILNDALAKRFFMYVPLRAVKYAD